MWETLKEAIVAYTGLSPATFFTVLALALAFYYAISGFFEPSPPPARAAMEEREVLPPPVEVGEITEEELKAYDGSDPKKPLLMAIKGQIYDVSQGRSNFSSLLSLLPLHLLFVGFFFLGLILFWVAWFEISGFFFN